VAGTSHAFLSAVANVSSDRVLERVMITGSGCVLIGGIAVINDTMRDRFSDVVAGSTSGELSSALHTVQGVLRDTLQTVGYSTSEHSLMAGFAVAALVLFVAMFRT
jgi:hypothetical protein